MMLLIMCNNCKFRSLAVAIMAIIIFFLNRVTEEYNLQKVHKVQFLYFTKIMKSTIVNRYKLSSNILKGGTREWAAATPITFKIQYNII